MQAIRAGVIGAGVMGMSIAQWLAFSGIGVTLKSGKAPSQQTFLDAVRKFYERKTRRGKIEQGEKQAIVDSCRVTATYADFKDVDIIFECVAEDLTVKKAVFQQLAGVAPRECILSSNTSCLSISEIAAETMGPERVLGVHFFQPVRFTRGVEVIGGCQTSPGTTDRAAEFLTSLGKAPIRVRESPGFFVNRVLGVYLMEAMRVLEEGNTTPGEIDDGMKWWGMQLGPFQVADLVGLDVLWGIVQVMAQAYGEKFKISPLHAQWVAEGRLGKKAGSGIYLYRSQTGADEEPGDALDPTPRPNDRTQGAVARIVAALINESLCCLQEEVIGASEVDMAAIECLRMPKGPLELTREMGPARLLKQLNELSSVYGARFNPAPLLIQWAEQGSDGYDPAGNPAASPV